MRIATFVPLLLAAAFLPATAQQDTGHLVVKVNPGAAGVFVDGKYLGPASSFARARKYAVAAGEREVRVVDPRYEPLETKVSIQAGRKTTVSQTLKPLPIPQPPFGTLRVKHPEKFAAVYINGKFYGHADEFNNFAQGMLLKPGEYEVQVVPASGSPITQKVNIEADKTVIVR